MQSNISAVHFHISFDSYVRPLDHPPLVLFLLTHGQDVDDGILVEQLKIMCFMQKLFDDEAMISKCKGISLKNISNFKQN